MTDGWNPFCKRVSPFFLQESGHRRDLITHTSTPLQSRCECVYGPSLGEIPTALHNVELAYNTNITHDSDRNRSCLSVLVQQQALGLSVWTVTLNPEGATLGH